jgi:membrane protease YdiL (CAAX protease family)
VDSLHLKRQDWLFILICLIVLALGVAIGASYFYKAFPEATIHFRYNKSQSGSIASSFFDELRVMPPKEFRQVGAFGYDGLAKTYLEKELGVEGARPYLGHPVRLWYWRHRWFKPATKEEFSVFVTPEGEVVRFNHEVDEKLPGADLEENAARILAERFLFGTMHQDSSRLSYVESERIGRPQRSDWSFTWKAAGIEPVKGSDYRYRVTLIGDQIGGYREFLHVPEAWTASYEKLRSYNELAGSMASIALMATVLAMVVVIFLRLRKHEIQWRTAILFGIVCAALVLLNQINELPLELYGYDTTSSWSGFWVSAVFQALVAAVGAGLLILLLTAAAETLYREKNPGQLAIPRMFSLQALRTKSAFKSILLGVTLTAIFFAYQVVFYLIAGHYGAWSPSEVPYDNLLNTAMPWLAVLFMGFFPAVSEEFISRAFSIPLLQKLFKNRYLWLAVLIPAVIWGFGHAGYPNEPFWIRGAEVGFVGIIVGIIMLRFGILATLVWHYTVDALYTSMLLFRSDNPYFVFTAAVAAGLLIVPLLIAILAYIRKGSFAPETGLMNADLGSMAEAPVEAVILEPAAPVEPVGVQYKPLANPKRILALGLLAAGVIAAVIPVARIGDFVSYPITKADAIKIVADSLRSAGWANPDTLNMAAFSRSPADDIEKTDPMIYLLKHAGSVERFNTIADERLGIGRWRVLAWQKENRLRFAASVHAKTGKIEGMYVWIPEELPGDSLAEARAQHIVDSILTGQGENLTAMTLMEHSSNVRPKRLDYNFSYEAKDGDPRNVAEAKYRRSASVEGRYVSVSARPFYKIPEQWTRDRKATTVGRSIYRGLCILIIGGLLVWATTVFLVKARKGLIPWKKIALLVIVPAAIILIGAANEFYLSQLSYFLHIETPWSVFRTSMVVGWLLSGAGGFALCGLALAFLIALYPEAVSSLAKRERLAAAKDGILAALAGIGVILLSRSIAAWLTAWKPEWTVLRILVAEEWVASPLPYTVLISNFLTSSLLTVVVLSFAIYVWQEPLKQQWQKGLGLLAALVLVTSMRAIEPGEWLLSALGGMAKIGLVYLLLRSIIGHRPFVLIATVMGVTLFNLTAEAVSSGNTFVTINGVLFAITIVAGFIAWIWWPAPRKA